jgi:hypothetical protein
MAFAPQYTGDPISAGVLVATANANRDGTTGTYATAYTFRASGATGGRGGRIDYLTLTSQTGASVVGNILMFINGTMVREIPTTVATPSTTVKGYQIPTSEGADVNGRLPLGIVCAPGDVVKFCTTLAQNIFARIEGGEF